MKELILHIPNLRLANYIDDYREHIYQEKNHFTLWLNGILEKIQAKTYELQLTRIYFGNEFCERLIPASEDVKEMMRICELKQLKLSLLTPYCTDLGLNKVKEIVESCSKNTNFDEVIVNDWGVLNFMYNHHPNISIVFGRVLDKMKRDPRFGSKDFERLFNNEGLKMLKSPSVSSQAYRDVIDEYGVRRAELDNVQQGLYLDDITGLKISVYIPYGFVTTGRICQFAGIHNAVEEKFTVTTKCKKECQSLTQYMQKSVSPIPNQVDDRELSKIRLIRKGNTVFYINDQIDEVLTNPAIDRIVYQPVFPV